MGYPTLHVYIGSLFDPATGSIFDEPSSWTDIVSDVREVSWQRGRQKDLDEVAVGTGSLVLRQKNSRDYDPTNTAGPYFPLASRPIKVEAVHSSTTYSLFRGWAVNWHVTWNPDWEPSLGLDYSEVQVDLVDAIALFQAYNIIVAAGDDSISARIGEVLDTVDFPAGMRDLTGGSQVQTAPSYPVRAWEHIQDCVRSDTELNVCYVDGRGYVVFGDPVTASVTFGDGGGSELNYSGTGIDYGTDLVYNSVSVSREGGTVQSVTERGVFGLRAYDRATLNTTDADALVLAQRLADEYQVPKARPEPMRIRPGNKDAVWTQVLDLDLEHRFTFVKRPPGGGDNFEQEMKIIGLETKAVPAYADWTTTYRLVGRSLEFPSSANVTDDFNRADTGPPPSASWTTMDSGLKVVSNQCAPNDNNFNDAYWSTSMTSADVDAFITIAVKPASGGWSRVLARLNPAGGGGGYGNGYSVRADVSAGTDSISVSKHVVSVETVLNTWSVELAAGDGLGIRCRGDQIEAWKRVSGVWSRVGAVTDATYDGTGSNNKVGLANYGAGVSTVARYDDFGANAN